MHRSRLACVVIDCHTDDLDPQAEFWAGALGAPVERPVKPGTENYRALCAAPDQPRLLVQQVDHPGRVHLDIETDDIEAEVARLEKLGATRVARVKSWWVLEAPGGQRFCVVPPQRDDFAEKANRWGED